MKPLLLHRTNGITGAFYAKHAHSNKLTKSTGVSHQLGIRLPVWSTLPDVDVPQDEAWDLDLKDYVESPTPVTFTIVTGGLPTGISLNPDGTFSGTVTNISGAGSTTFRATNYAGSAVSDTLNWTIPIP